MRQAGRTPDQPAAGRSTPDETLTRVGRAGPDRAGSILVVVALTALALAVAKPWSWGAGPGVASRPLPAELSVTPSTSATAIASKPSASPVAGSNLAGTAASPNAAADPACYPAPDWRLYTIERDEGRFVLVWYSLQPEAVADTADPTVNGPAASVHVYGELLRLGFCPAVTGRPRPIESVHAWRVAGPGPRRGVVAIPLRPSATFAPHDPEAGALFDPPQPSSSDAAGGRAGAWPPGRYVFAVRFITPPPERFRFAVDVAEPPVLATGSTQPAEPRPTRP